MKLNQPLTLRVEDFPSETSWIGRLCGQLNSFFAATDQVLDSNLDFDSNFKSVTRDFSFSGFQSFDVPWPYSGNPPKEVRVLSAYKGDQRTPTILLPAWSYNSAKGTITIHSLIELTGNGAQAIAGAFSLTIRAII